MPESHKKFHSVNGKRQILVVDDEIINREIMGNILMMDDAEEAGYEVLYAEDGQEALRLIRENKNTLSLVLLDLMMPVLSGLDVLRIKRDDPAIKDIPVIVITADQESEEESLNLGAIDFIPKPYPRESVIRARIHRNIELSEDRQIIQSTERDPLTDLFNREYFFSYAEQFDQYHKGVETDALVLDVNHFHMLNERYGKAYGDQVLRHIGERIREMVQDADGIVCRREADTFLVYCRHGKDYEAILEHASIGLADREMEAGGRVRLRMGVYPNVDKSIDIERRFDRAKNAADTVRGSYAHNIAFYDNQLHESELYEEQLIEDFQEAIARKQFQVYYQPKFDIRGQEPVLTSAEALIRWQHPTLGMISPGVFIPLFEKNGLIQSLDHYVWEEAAEQIRDWKERFGFSIPVSVNVSRIDIFDPNLVTLFQDIIEKYRLRPEELMLEITESAYTDEAELIIDTVKRLRELGFKIEMDDFGTGYSSLGMVSHLPFDTLKMDMLFVRNAFQGSKDVRMLEIIIDIADYLMVPVIAEGVETQEQLQELKAMGCAIVQGYYFSKPVPAAEFDVFMEELKKLLDASSQVDDYMDIVSEAKTRLNRMRSEAKMITYSKIADALAADYFSIYYVDMDTEDFIEYSSSDEYSTLGIETGGTDFFATSRHNIKRVIFPEDQKMVLDALHKEFLQKELEKNFTFTMNYRLMFGEEPTWVSFKASRMKEEKDNHIVIGVNNIDAQMKRLEAFEQAQSERITYERIADALSRDYYSIYCVNIDTDEFIEYSSHRDYRELQVEQSGKAFFDDCYRNVIRLVYPEDLELALSVWDKEKLLANLSNGQTVSATYRLMFDGIPRYINAKVIQMQGEKDSNYIIIGVSNVDKQMRREQEHEKELDNARELANRDSLTGVKSKHAFVGTETEFNQKIADGEAEAFAIVVCDVNGLKQVNDTQGHKAGDVFIKNACAEICETFKHSPVYRVGGDEFVVLLYGQDYEHRMQLVESLASRNQSHMSDGGVVIACGFSEYRPGQDLKMADVFERADALMYENKKLLKAGRVEGT